MRTAEARLSLLHQRAWQLSRKKSRRMLAYSAIRTTVLLAVLFMLTVRLGKLQEGFSQIRYTGASLLGESAGGYVLVAVIAFTAGVVITVVIKRYKKPRGRRGC